MQNRRRVEVKGTLDTGSSNSRYIFRHPYHVRYNTLANVSSKLGFSIVYLSGYYCISNSFTSVQINRRN
jgi:hypothetical protein